MFASLLPWAEQLTLAIGKVKRLIDEQPDLFGDEHPSIVQIKQKWGGLRVYEGPGCNQATSEEIQWRVDQIEQTCVGCSNSAQRQNVLGFVTTLCSCCCLGVFKVRPTSVMVWNAIDHCFII